MEEVVIKINGKDIRLKDFPKRVTHNVVVGLVKSLNLEEEPREIVIHVRINQENSGGP
ncbi:conserved hypothetical protein [Hydrogenobacter thermophilus TK-6]|uniref:Uncharacterized protein n=1 Tax=Hydrogenobacter thermophilus (strain DSM 6534 / IAM 12695 / TK-6) TaxID=608538 RepID=D3DH65_HYDTT|nr:hypothetical protein [Hydrogenobacter thermophilus]ADO45105.1 conserved hypothetical protein [Hydrogenobacter thermophilus TK-6]BAI69167.1 hypothetical protein HTH_0707 [Hydrogenobacter thermophilus TK-6]